MRHPFRVREIAAQAGLSEATVDRVLHGRPGVRPSTVRQVERALDDLGRQEAQLQLGGRTTMVDVVVQAPLRFSVEVRTALEAELPALRPAVVRSRFHLLEGASAADVVAVLDRVAATGSHGVVLKAPDTPEVVAAVSRLVGAGVPVVTLVTDLPTSARAAYAGLDNRGAGATAAYLVEAWLGDAPGDVLVVRGHGSFRGEDEREAGFRAVVLDAASPRPDGRPQRPARSQVDVVDDEESATAVTAGVRVALAQHPGVRAVYSMYSGAGGTRAVLDALADAGHPCRVVVAHDLDAEHAALLRAHRLSAVLHHDLRTDLRRTCRVLLQARGALPGPVRSWPSPVQVVTPYNLQRGPRGEP